MDMLKTLSLAGLVPVIKLSDANDAVPLCKALLAGGLPVAEITFRTAAAEQAIKNVHAELPEVILGAGTVLTKDQVDRAQAAGAGYIVSPGFNPEVVRHCQQQGIAVLPGCANPSDIEMALSLGLDTVKFFPAEALGGLKLIKAMSAPYGQMQFVPTGGIGEGNFLDYLAFPKVCAVGGSWMVPDDAIQAKDWERVTRLTQSAVAKMLGFELAHVALHSGSEDAARRDAALIGAMFGFAAKESQSGFMLDGGFEVLKRDGRGERGHIAIKTHDLQRARWHMERRGYAFDEASVVEKGGKPVAIYFQGEIAGFAWHLLQR